MSAYLLSKKSIDVLVYTAFYRSGHPPSLEGSIDIWSDRGFTFYPNDLGQELVDQNYASVSFRYRENYRPYLYEYCYHSDFKCASDLALLRLCNCYDYQSSETDHYERSNAANIIAYIRDKIIRNLPGYAEAPLDIYTEHFS